MILFSSIQQIYTDYCPGVPVSQKELAWRASHRDQLEPYVVHSNDSPWGHLICCWQEKQPGKKSLSHFYAICVDTKDGGFYLDCRPNKIFAKCLAQLIVRPFYALLKTIYHLTLASIFYETALMAQGYQDKNACLTNSLRSLADIVRTPLYAIVLMVTTIAILAMALFDPETIYDGRKLLGAIECQANWGETRSRLTLARCFQPIDMSVLESYSQENSDTIYPNQNLLERQLINFTRKIIRYQRRHFDLFACQSLDNKTAYVSPIILFTK